MEKGEIDLYTYVSQSQASISMQEKLIMIQQADIKQVTIPINFLHSNGLFHRDIKPENYLKFGTKFKLIDFGLVNKSQQGRIKTIGVGTPLFSAPEVISNQNNYSDKVDVWSLVCLFYVILSSSQSLINTNNYETIKEQILGHQNNPQKIFN